MTFAGYFEKLPCLLLGIFKTLSYFLFQHQVALQQRHENAVVVAQLDEQLLLTPVAVGLKPAINNSQ